MKKYETNILGQERKNKTTKNRQIEVATWVVSVHVTVYMYVCVCVPVRKRLYGYLSVYGATIFVRRFADWLTDCLPRALLLI